VLHAAAFAAARLLDLTRWARELPARSPSELLAELLMSDSAVNEDLLDRARELAVPVSGWHVAVRIEADASRLPALCFRAGVGTPHEGPLGLRASAAEARGALLAARVAGRPSGVAAHDAVGVRRMLMEWYASDTARASVRDQLAPLEKLGPARAETAIQTLAVCLDQQGSIVKTAQKLHLHRNAVANRLRGITELLEIDLDDPDQRLALQLACRARLLD
jgi:DNA-binding PucR family transcriptional regulator